MIIFEVIVCDTTIALFHSFFLLRPADSFMPQHTTKNAIERTEKKKKQIK